MSGYAPKQVRKVGTDPEQDYARPGNMLTGVTAQDFRVFIEGIEVQFSDMQVISTYGSFPQAVITVPYLPLLEEIGRGYHPKVYIFFREYFSDLQESVLYERAGGEGKADRPDSRAALRRSLKLLFAGEIVASQYSKVKGEAGVQTVITFQCKHKSSVLEDIQIGFARFGLNEISSQTDASLATSTGGLHDFNPMITSYKMLQGVRQDKVFNVPPLESGLPAEDDEGIMASPIDLRPYKEQFKGIPGAVLRLWNSLCNDAYAFSHISNVVEQMYIPLVQNMKFFQTLSGHPLIEDAMEATRVEAAVSRGKTDTTSALSIGTRSVYNPRQLTGDGVESVDGEEGKLDKAVQAIIAEATLSAIRAGFGQMPATDSLHGVLDKFLRPVFYDMVFLASPVDRGVSAPPVETIIKPAMPMYFSPRCNVLYPSMYNSLSISDNYGMPTRSMTPVYALANIDLPQRLHFKSPYLVRKALAERVESPKVDNAVIGNTVVLPVDTVAPHELGVGVTWAMGAAPSWVPLMLSWARENDQDAITGGGKSDASVALYRHILEYTDYQHGINFMASRTGNVSGGFNPYIVVGYPMDIIDPSPDRPSYHALCTQVVHSISNTGVTTGIGFTGAASYEQLYSMDFSMGLPWLTDLLGIRSASDYDTTARYVSLTTPSKTAQKKADRFYLEVLGVEAAMISEMSSYKYEDPPESAVPNPASAQSWRNSQALARRHIQSMEGVETVGHKYFVLREDIAAEMVKGSVIKDTLRPLVLREGMELSQVKLRPMGMSLFLDYTSKVPSSRKAMATFEDSESRRRGAGDRVPVKEFSNLRLGWKGDVRLDWKEDFERMVATLQAEVTRYDQKLQEEFGTPAFLFHSIIAVESYFRPDARNPGKVTVGSVTTSVAVGLCQVYYQQFIDKNTGTLTGKVFGATWSQVSDNPSENLRVGYQLLAQKLKTAKTDLNALALTTASTAPSASAILNTAILYYGGYSVAVKGYLKRHLRSGKRGLFVDIDAAFPSIDNAPVSAMRSSQDKDSSAVRYLSKIFTFQATANKEAAKAAAVPNSPAKESVVSPIVVPPAKLKAKTLSEALSEVQDQTLL